MRLCLFALAMLSLAACGDDDDDATDAAVDAPVADANTRDADGARDADAAAPDAEVADADASVPDASVPDAEIPDAEAPGNCPDYMAPPPGVAPMSCTESSECTAEDRPVCIGQSFGTICVGMTCGACDAETQGCFEGINGGCGETAICADRCGSDAGCDDDERCVADDDTGVMACEPIPCDEGYECPVNFDCDRTPGTFDEGEIDVGEHFCIRKRCSLDEMCDCGTCIDGKCHSGPGFCSPPVPG